MKKKKKETKEKKEKKKQNTIKETKTKWIEMYQSQHLPWFLFSERSARVFDGAGAYNLLVQRNHSYFEPQSLHILKGTARFFGWDIIGGWIKERIFLWSQTTNKAIQMTRR